MQVERYQKYKVASVMSESPHTYAAIAHAVVWISECFTLSLSGKLQKHTFSTWLFFSEVSFYHSFKYLKLLR